MHSFEIIWLDLAQDDLIGLRAYIAQENHIAAAYIAEKIFNGVNGLIDHPYIGRPGRVTGTRELVINNTPFILPYRVRGNFIEILSVIHDSQDWPEDFSD
jgi:toxin ParE1/3/4